MMDNNMIPQLIITNSRRQTSTYIRNFVKKNHINPNLIFTYEPDKTIITIEQIREISGLFTRQDPSTKVIIVYDFDTAKEPSQNALLKTLEEKSESAQFFIVVRSELSVLPTIGSRCQKIKLQNEINSTKEIQLDKPLPDLLSDFQYIEKDAKKAIAACDDLLFYFKNYLLKNAETIPLNDKRTAAAALVIKEIWKVRRIIDQNNLGPQIAIDHLLIFIHNHVNNLLA